MGTDLSHAFRNTIYPFLFVDLLSHSHSIGLEQVYYNIAHIFLLTGYNHAIEIDQIKQMGAVPSKS